MNRVLLRLLLLGAIGVAAAPGRTFAQSASAPADKKQVAKQYVHAGVAAQESGDYETALTFYVKAYQLVPHPTLLFNMAQAHRLAGHIEQALSLYKRYLAEDPSGAQATTARELVAEIEARTGDDARKTDEANDARPTQVTTATPSAGLAADPRAGDARDTASRAPPPPGRLLRIAGLATGAGGAAAVAVGIGFGLHARSLSRDLSQHDAVYDPEKMRAGERANTIAIVGMTGGAALIATGAALYWWGYTQGRASERVSLAPFVSHQAAGLIVSGALP